MQPNDPINGRDIRVETHNALADWLDFDRTARKIVCRRGAHRPFTLDERATMDVARSFQDDGRISILTRHDGRQVTFIAERIK